MVPKRVLAPLTFMLALVLGGTAASAGPAMTMQFVQGQQTATPVDLPVLLASFPQAVVADPFSTTPIMDVRAFNTILMQMNATNLGGATFTDNDVINVSFTYYADPAGTITTFREENLIFRTGAGGNPGSGQFQLTDIIYGPYLQVDIYEETASGRTIRLDYSIYGSYRSIPVVPHNRNGKEPNGTLYRFLGAIAAGGNSVSIATYGFGNAMAMLKSGAVGGATMDIQFAGLVFHTEQLVAAAANTRVRQQLIVPKREMKVTITNNAGAVQTIEAWIFLQL